MTTSTQERPNLIGQLRADQAQQDAQRAADLPEFVRHAQRIGADFEVQVHTTEQLRAVLVAIGGHNHFDPEKTAKALDGLLENAMRCRVKQFSGGPEIYLQVAFFEGQRLRARSGYVSGAEINEELRQGWTKMVIGMGKWLKADEISVTQRCGNADPVVVWNEPGDRPYEIRLWWD